jgi:ATP-binding cassette, subfamily B, bacterial
MSHHRLIIPDPDAPPITRATVRRVIRTFRPYRRTVGLVGMLILITSAIGVVNPLLIKVIFDQALFCGPGCPNLDLLYWLVGLMVAIPIGSGVIGIWQSYLSNVVGQQVMQDLRNALYTHLQRMPLRFFTTTRTGEIQSRLSNDVGGIQSVVTDTASSVLANVVIVISTVVAMLILSWQLTLLSLGTLPFFFWLMYRVGKARREVAANTQKSLADLSAITEETLSVSGMLLSKAFGRQRYETDRFRRENERLAGLQVRQQMIGRSFFATIQIFFSVTRRSCTWSPGSSCRVGEPSSQRETSLPSPRSRAVCSSRLGRCSRSGWRSRAPWLSSTGSSNTSTCLRRSRTRPTRWIFRRNR